jgi:hypothetical protein
VPPHPHALTGILGWDEARKDGPFGMQGSY